MAIVVDMSWTLCILLFATSLQLGQSEAIVDRDNGKGIIYNFLFGDGCKRCRCGVPNRESRLIGGEYLRSHEFPWLVLIQAMNRTVVGALINDRHVLTAATPLIGLTVYDVKITVGQFDRCSSDVTSINTSVETIAVHPEYGADARANDLALIRTNAPVPFRRTVGPICLPTPGASYLGEVATASSWTDANGRTTCRPRKIGLPVLDREECLGTAAYPATIGTDKGCAGVIGTPGVLCEDDVGVPLSYRNRAGIYEIIGIISDRNVCSSTTPSTSAYTMVDRHLNWIVANTRRSSCYCSRAN